MAHINSTLLWHKYAESYFKEGMKVLEISPVGYPSYYESHFLNKGISIDWNGLDVRVDYIGNAGENPKFTLSSEEYKYPFPSDHFDIVFADQVLSCVGYLWPWYQELVRITKPGGLIVIVTAYSYERCPSPIDSWRVSADGMLKLNEYFGLQTLQCVTESLELEHFGIKDEIGHYFPGTSFSNPRRDANKQNKINKIKRFWNNLVGYFPSLRMVLLNPVSCSFDTISIAQK